MGHVKRQGVLGGGIKGAAAKGLTNADHFELHFDPQNQPNPRQKAMVVATTVLIDCASPPGGRGTCRGTDALPSSHPR